MHVADHALAGGNRPGQAVLDGMARLVLGDRGVARGAPAGVAIRRPRARVGRVPVVGVDHVAGGAAARSVVARVVVGPQEGEVRVVEPGLVEVDQGRADPGAGSGAALREADVGAARVVRQARAGVADLAEERGGEDPAPLERPEVLARLGRLPARQGQQERQRAAGRLVRGRGLRDPLRPTVRTVALAQESALQAHDAVGVAGGGPEDRRGGHGALGHRVDLLRVAGAAGRPGDAEVARVDEAHELHRLLEERGVAAHRVGRAGPALRVAGQDVGAELRFLVGRVLGAGARGWGRARVAAVAVGTAQVDGVGGMHGLDPPVAGEAAGGLGPGGRQGLAHQGRRGPDVALAPGLALGEGGPGQRGGQGAGQGREQDESAEGTFPHQKVTTRLVNAE